MPDINREASEFWNSLKPMIDEEIKAQTRGMVQRRKMKVTTAPSLNTNKIGVTEPFGTEMLIPFTTNLISATVGDVVWVEFMYGMTNAFASMFASADEKDWDVAGNLSVIGNAGIGGDLGVSGSTSLQNTTVNGVLDITPRRCEATLSGAGWYRVLHLEGYALGTTGIIIHLDITRNAYSNASEEHHVDLLIRSASYSFVNEISSSNVLYITKIRYIRETNQDYGYVDIYYGSSTNNIVTVDFSVSSRNVVKSNTVAESLQSVADSPSGETVLAEHTFAANYAPALGTIYESNQTYAQIKNLSADVMVENKVVLSASNPVYVPCGSYSAFLLVGFLQGIGSVLLGVTKEASTLKVRNLMTNSDFSSNYVSFAIDGSNIKITSTLASGSIIAIYRGGQ